MAAFTIFTPEAAIPDPPTLRTIAPRHINSDMHDRKPTEFGPDIALVAFWLILTAVPLLLSISDLFKLGLRPDLLEMTAVAVIFPLAVFVFVSRFRAKFDDRAFTYRHWGRTISVPYEDIDHILITNRTPVSKEAVGAFLVTHDGRRYAFWPKLFPRPAVERFMSLGEVRD